MWRYEFYSGQQSHIRAVTSAYANIKLCLSIYLCCTEVWIGPSKEWLIQKVNQQATDATTHRLMHFVILPTPNPPFYQNSYLAWNERENFLKWHATGIPVQEAVLDPIISISMPMRRNILYCIEFQILNIWDTSFHNADIDECAYSPCGNEGSECVNTIGSYDCTCGPRYYLSHHLGQCVGKFYLGLSYPICLLKEWMN